VVKDIYDYSSNDDTYSEKHRVPFENRISKLVTLKHFILTIFSFVLYFLHNTSKSFFLIIKEYLFIVKFISVLDFFTIRIYLIVERNFHVRRVDNNKRRRLRSILRKYRTSEKDVL
jgi:hypothetical protein